MRTVAFFNNKGGVGSTSLVYHLAWMFADRGCSVLAVDLDPRADLTAMFLDEAQLEQLWEGGADQTIYEALLPLIGRVGDVSEPLLQRLTGGLHLIPGNLSLSGFEDLLSENWPKCLDGDTSAFRVLSAFHRIVDSAATRCNADIVLLDVGPNLGAINRSALIAASQVVVPLAPDLFSLHGMKNLGPTLRTWRTGWKKSIGALPPDAGINLPSGDMTPVGYVVMQQGIRDSRPVKAYHRWMNRIPHIYREYILDDAAPFEIPPDETDPHRLALLKHYRSLMPMAMDSRKPIFYLKPADGAVGAHVEAVRACYTDFLSLAKIIGGRAGVSIE